MTNTRRNRKAEAGEILTVREAASLLGVTTQSVRDLLKRGRLPRTPIVTEMEGVRKSDVLAYRAEREGRAA